MSQPYVDIDYWGDDYAGGEVSIENDLFAALKSLVGNRMSPNTFPQPASGGPPTWPAIRYTFIDIIPFQDICGDGDDDTAEARVQLDLVANTFDGSCSLRNSVMAVMRTFSPPARLQISSSTYDAETKTQRWQLDYLFYPSS